MGIRKTLNSIVSRPMEGAIRELIEEVLASRSFVRPGEIASLRREVSELQSTDELEARIAAVEARIAALQASVEAARTPTPAIRRTAAPAGDRGCKVPGCEGSHRARGFCGRHYQMIRRSTLPGFVGPDGRVPFEDGTTWQVDASHYGSPVERVDGGLSIDGAPVEATPLDG